MKTTKHYGVLKNIKQEVRYDSIHNKNCVSFEITLGNGIIVYVSRWGCETIEKPLIGEKVCVVHEGSTFISIERDNRKQTRRKKIPCPSKAENNPYSSFG